MSAPDNLPEVNSERRFTPGVRRPLLSIHMSSNRPRNFVRFLDRLESVTSDFSALEVIVKIDDTDKMMNALLPTEIAKRPFRLKYLSTPLEGGFFGLWRSFDDLLRATDEDAYFVVNLNDEMGIKTPGWDRVLRRYVGLYSDHIFRLRTSPHRHRNYYDFWEPGFANDTSALMTREWLLAGGGWCPCNGPDTFQECVAYYFGWLDRFNNNRIYRDRPIDDIEFSGHGASAGLTGRAFRRRTGESLQSHFTLMSHRMQEEAARRAQKLHAHIWAHKHGLARSDIRDNLCRRTIEIVSLVNADVRHSLPYRLSFLRITATNLYRKLNCGYYLAGGRNNRLPWIENFLSYLAYRHAFLDFWFEFSLRTRVKWLSRLPTSWMRSIPNIPRHLLKICRGAAYRVDGSHSRAYLVARAAIRRIISRPLRRFALKPRDTVGSTPLHKRED